MNAIELHDDASAEVGFRDEEIPSVPSYAAFGEKSSDCLITMAVASSTVERQFHRPIVRKIDDTPRTVVEVFRGGAVAVSCFGKVGEVRGAVVEIFLCIVCMSQRKPPAGIHQQALTRNLSTGKQRKLYEENKR